MADLTQLERIERGRQARELLNNGLLVEAFKGVRENIVQQWIAELDSAARERLWAGLHGADRARIWLQAVVDDGEIAKAEAHQAQQ